MRPPIVLSPFPNVIYKNYMPSYLIIALAVLTIYGCKQEELKIPTSYTLFVANAGVNSKLITNFTSTPILTQNSRGIYYVQTSQKVSIADTTAPDNPIINKSLDYTNGVYSIFVAGQSPTFETIIKEETDLPLIPNDKIYSSADSVVNVRFINLSPNSVPLKIKISTATTNEADALAYKDITTWRSFKAVASSTTYSLQIRNASTDALITTYSFVANATKRFKNVTLMIRGLQGTTSGVNSFGVTEINYF